MAHLKDMEELIETIYQPRIADYMREAMSCYMTGAYRGCIVLSSLALFDDLVDKIEELGRVDSNAKAVYREVAKRRNSQDVYENYLLQQLKSKSLIPELTAEIIDTIRTSRNRSAHPSGHHPSAEEARYIFSESIRLVLSKPKLSTSHAITQITARLSNTNFFPTNTSEDVMSVVEEEIKELHHGAYPRLIIELTELIVNSEDRTTLNNVRLFMGGICSLSDEKFLTLVESKYINSHIDDDAQAAHIFSFVAINPKLFEIMGAVTARRFKRILTRKIETVSVDINPLSSAHPSTFFRHVFRSLGKDYTLNEFRDEINAYFSLHPYDSSLYFVLKHDREIFETYLVRLLAQAGSYNFNTANNFVHRYPRIERDIIEILSEGDAFRIILKVLNAANFGAFGPIELRDNNFEDIQLTKNRAIAFITEKTMEAQNYIDEILDYPLSVHDIFQQVASKEV